MIMQMEQLKLKFSVREFASKVSNEVLFRLNDYPLKANDYFLCLIFYVFILYYEVASCYLDLGICSPCLYEWHTNGLLDSYRTNNLTMQTIVE